MAASFNSVHIMGTCTRDIELRYVGASNTAVCDLGLAINDRRKNAAGEWVEETTFCDVTLWGRTAEVAAEYATKGSNVFIDGKLKLESWTDKEGQKRSKLKVVGDRLQLLGAPKGQGGPSGQPSRPSAPPAPRANQFADEPSAFSEAPPPRGYQVDDADIPF